jgi:hypothetical protein
MEACLVNMRYSGRSRSCSGEAAISAQQRERYHSKPSSVDEYMVGGGGECARKRRSTRVPVKWAFPGWSLGAGAYRVEKREKREEEQEKGKCGAVA